VRPVFSSVVDILERNLAKVLFEAFMTDRRAVTIDYDFKEKQITADYGKGHHLNIPYVGRVDKIRDTQIDDVVANVSVHESGHAVVYGALFGLAPLQLKSRVASTYVGGFTFPHQIHQTKQSMIDKIKVYLAGGLAEEVIFGEGNATIGRENDRWETTVLALDYIRKYGFTPEFQAYYTTNPATSMDVFITDKATEDLIRQLVAETKAILTENKAFLIELSDELAKKGSMKADEVAATAAKHGLNLVVKEESHLYISDYSVQLKEA
jgi:Peptidase family M41